MAKKKKETPTKEKQFVFTAENVLEITAKINDGYSMQRYMNPWFMNETGVRRAGCVYSISESEVQEYIKCKLDIHYFSEKYCNIKREDGTIGPMKLRDYQKDILDLYTKNRFSILMASRQVGKCSVFNTSIEVMLDDGTYLRTTLGNLYYYTLSKYRKLSFLERTKVLLYNIIYTLNQQVKRP